MHQNEHSGKHEALSNSPDRGADLEPVVDPDSAERLAEERPDVPHAASRFEASNGAGTVSSPPRDSGLLEHPILDGSTQSAYAEATVPNPHRGQVDPALVTKQPALNSTNTSRWLIAATVATVVVTAVLLLLTQWNPVWCGVGIVVALVSLLVMLLVRASRMPPRPRLRIDALLMAVIWLVPLAIIIWTLVVNGDEIW